MNICIYTYEYKYLYTGEYINIYIDIYIYIYMYIRVGVGVVRNSDLNAHGNIVEAHKPTSSYLLSIQVPLYIQI